MWKKDETPKAPPASQSAATPQSAASEQPQAASKSFIGSSVVIDGDIRGSGDLVIEGQVNMNISLPNNTVTVGASGHVKAKVNAATIIIEGKVNGDLSASEQIDVRPSGNVNGNIVAPKAQIDPGAQFAGNINIGQKPGNPAPAKSKPAASSSSPAPQKNAQTASKTADSQLSGKS